MNKPKPKKEIKPGRGWAFANRDKRGNIRFTGHVYRDRFSDFDMVHVSFIPTRDYRRLLADARAYRELMEGK